jgi:hypothetical protein
MLFTFYDSDSYDYHLQVENLPFLKLCGVHDGAERLYCIVSFIVSFIHFCMANTILASI